MNIPARIVWEPVAAILIVRHHRMIHAAFILVRIMPFADALHGFAVVEVISGW